MLSLDAAQAGVAVDNLILYEPPFVVDDSRAPVPDDYLARLSELLSRDRRGDMVELFMRAAVGLSGERVAAMRDTPT